MNITARDRFILFATASYATMALAWIFLSDQLLAVFTDLGSVVWLSMAKGSFFVAATATGFFFALRAVPSVHSGARETLLDAFAIGVTAGRRPRWLLYTFALVITCAMLLVRQGIAVGFGERPMLILFMLPIILSALLGGLGPGIVSTAVAALGADMLAIPPLHNFQTAASHDLFQWAFLVVNGLAVSILSELLRRSLLKADLNRRFLDSVISGTSDAVFVKDLRGRYLLANAAASAFVGKPLHAILGHDDHTLFPPTSATDVMAKDSVILASGLTQTYEEYVTTHDGKALVFLVTKGPVFDAAGYIKGVFGIARDITGRKLAESTLRASEAALREAQHLASVGSWAWDIRTGVHVWSEEIYHIYDRAPNLAPAVYPEVQKYFTPEGWAALAAAEEKILADGVPYECDAEVVRPDGAHRWITARGQATLDAQGAVIGLHGTVQDVTARKVIQLKLQTNEERLQMAIDATSDGLWDWDLRSGLVYRSPRYYEVTGYSAEQDNGDFNFLKRTVHPDDFPLVLNAIDAHRKGQTTGIEVDYRLVKKTGEIRWARAIGRTVARAETGEPTRIIGTLSDVTDRKMYELAQREAATVFQSSYEGIMVVSPARVITKINPAFTRITGYTPEDAIGQPSKLLSSGRHGPSFYAELWQSVQDHGFWRGEIWNRRKNGELYAELLSISAVNDATGAVQHYVGIFSDISQLKAHEAELDRIAHYDPLTGLPNRRLLSDRLGQAILRSSRDGVSLAVCYLDLDGFKMINDKYGHSAGDALLVGVTASLRQVLRAEDTLSRLGGDEFVLLLVDISSPDECTLILNRVMAAVCSSVKIDGVWVAVSASVGVCLYPDDNVDADTLLRHADQAMYLAKQSGKNRYHLFDPESDRKAQVHRKYLDRLRVALEDQEFVLHYQPKVDLVTGVVFGVEALIRWQHPERGILAPAEFLSHINGSDLEKPLGDWVIKVALAQAADWHASGLQVSVSVNVSANHLLHSDFYDCLRTALQNNPGVPTSQFELEVLETAAIADVEQAAAILQRCRGLGVHFALDDFGTGYSSLTYLRKLPVDTLKIDQSFVLDMLTDADDLGIVEGVIRLARAFNRQVIAEGVETLEHGSALLRMDCRLAQGYGIARPMPAENVIGWSRQWTHDAAWLALSGASILP